MKYSEMVRFLNDNGIKVMQPVIASELDAQLETDISEEEFEEICASVEDKYLCCFEEPDIWELVDEELTARGYKGDYFTTDKKALKYDGLYSDKHEI